MQTPRKLSTLRSSLVRTRGVSCFAGEVSGPGPSAGDATGRERTECPFPLLAPGITGVAVVDAVAELATETGAGAEIGCGRSCAWPAPCPGS